ncbi:30S ribosomal protein S6 [Buchnera aphidicola]|uniref:Small ribosomal subunit protein bS6 n=1 Tax=Buchnera aphidicola (Stegophylla sp.) TaxID=2315800 RepID=A0A4D6YKP5_9GAMM|nr:30S ribosomal protein S6 [Buchnera aphidicola (Stegophylla sp.)]QCI26554.1 30S ribosomal protein S6 [Buchnera aphidicola (Stegophylla sp.)]
MRHYEIVIIIHPDQTSEQIMHIIKHYKTFIMQNHGIIYRLEDWGRRQLAYPIKKLHKAYYILMNIHIEPVKISELKEILFFNEVVLRSMIITVKEKIVVPSVILKLKNDKMDKR